MSMDGNGGPTSPHILLVLTVVAAPFAAVTVAVKVKRSPTPMVRAPRSSSMSSGYGSQSMGSAAPSPAIGPREAQA